MSRDRGGAVVALMLVVGLTSGCARAEDAGRTTNEPDTAFAALQERGEAAMGVDQYTSTHFFDALPDGGRIELQRDVDDAEGVAQIRRHLREIAAAFEKGDFDTPAFVHMQTVPGTAVMAAKRDVITYTFSELPRGGELRIVTRDAEAISAIHEFMAFQRSDHRASGEAADSHDGMDHDGMDHGAMEHDTMDHGAMDHGAMQHDSLRSGTGGGHGEDPHD